MRHPEDHTCATYLGHNSRTDRVLEKQDLAIICGDDNILHIVKVNVVCDG